MRLDLGEQIPGTYPERLTRAGAYLAEMLESYGLPVISPFELFELIRLMYEGSAGKALYLREESPTAETVSSLRTNLRKSGLLLPDRDYKGRMLRIVSNPDLPADDIVCLADPTCYISHLSALQRWGLTERTSNTLIVTRPDRVQAIDQLNAIMRERLGQAKRTPCPLKYITHPEKVRRRSVTVFETKLAGASIAVRGEHAKISAIGQTFLDTLQKPDLCGGMSHVLDIWEEHAETYFEQIIAAIDRSPVALAKSRAGYILEERLGKKHPLIDGWKKFGQRGSSRKLDPAAPFSPQFSETWMLSLNV